MLTMERRMNCVTLFILIASVVFLIKDCHCCKFLNGDHSSFDWIWSVAGPESNKSIHYEISLCQPLNYSEPHLKDCINSTICMIVNDTAINMGNYVNDADHVVIQNPAHSGMSWFLTTDSSCNGKVRRSVINFVCGATLGVPELAIHSECEVHFMWQTSFACKTPLNHKEVPCYVIDSEGNTRDLTNLIKSTGGYHIQNKDPSLDLVINVCASITADNSTKNCPANSSACRIKGTEYISFGEPETRLQEVAEGLILTYKASHIAAECWLKPETKILFRCPARGKSNPPRLVSNLYCQYEVEWETEYACPNAMLSGDFKKCQFYQDAHGAEIDLSPLRNESTSYQVPAVVGGKNVSFHLNVCGGLKEKHCNGTTWKSIAVCLNESLEQSFIIGTTTNPVFKYVDNQIFLTYGNGGTCSRGLHRESTINFVCNMTAENKGIGMPKYASSNDCEYNFEWQTKYACTKHIMNDICYVKHGKDVFNLRNLIKTGDAGTWEAIDGRLVRDKFKNASFYLNVCGLASHCNFEASACVRDDSGHILNLGRYASPPVYDATLKSVVLNYQGGSSCNGDRLWKTAIRFICISGQVMKEPVLTNINNDDCVFEFEWHTFEACGTGAAFGSECHVYDSNSGLAFDLSPLKSSTYEVVTDKYKFYLGICGSVPDSPCSKNSNSSGNIGGCQVENKDSSARAWKIGEANSNLSYVNGVLKLIYSFGDPYNNQNHSARLTEIIFICDQNKEIGRPQFVNETSFMYIFYWYTNLACPPSLATKCVVHDPIKNQVYDLSSLSKTENNWVSFLNDEDVQQKAYINLCRPLVPVEHCNYNAAVCVVNIKDDKEEAFVRNAGQIDKPTMTDDGHLQLNYTQGELCNAFGESVGYSSVIHFLCSKGLAEEEGPKYLGKIGNCQYTFLWATQAACPTGEVFVKNECRLTNPITGFIFDLNPLKKNESFYSVSSNKRTFQLNICGAVKGGCISDDNHAVATNISVCETDNSGKLLSNLGSSDAYILSYFDGRDLSLTYKNASNTSAGNSPEVVINFPCSNTTTDSEPIFLKQENNKYLFEMKTSLTCQDQHFDCTFVDHKGNEYDLSPLSKSDRNWYIRDSRPQRASFRYYINFCRPLLEIKDYICPGGSIGACQVNAHDPFSEGFSLGSQYNMPVVSEDGVVTLRYTGGSPCSNGQFKRSLRVNMFCSYDLGELTFFGETPECEYIFTLNTPAACPLKTSQGHHCIVTDPVFGYNFDLRPLKNMIRTVTVGEYKYFINVCAPLEGYPNPCETAGICQKKPVDPKFAKNLGQPNSDLVYRNGVISLHYKNGTGNCHGQYNRSSIIVFTCDHAASLDKAGPTFITEAEDCTYLFEWPTSFACPPFRVVNCFTESSDGQYYDLSKLSLTDDNYYVKNPLSSNKTFVINVCRSVVHTPDSVCPYMSGTCLLETIGKTQQMRALNLGQVAHSPVVINGKLKLRYTSGDVCNVTGATSARFMETVIDFICNKQKMHSQPEYIGRDGCTYYFEWTTAYACPVNEVEESSDNCTVEDPLTGYIFNLTSLMSNNSYIAKTSNHKFYLNVCSKLQDSPCSSNSGACQEEMSGGLRHWDVGVANSKLYYHSGALFLNYSGGDSCHGNRFERNTIIQFTCGPDTGNPEFIAESDDCTYYFSWKTRLACHSLMHCAIKNGSSIIDLSSLADSGYHVARSSLHDDAALYYMTVCSSFKSFSTVSCPPGSAICRVTDNVFENLGSIQHPPFFDFEGHATILYTNGSRCSTNPAEINKARIVFLCSSVEVLGEPVLIEKTAECLHVFEWRTSIVCPEGSKETPEAPSCLYSDPSKGIYFDMTSIRKDGSYYEVAEDDKKGIFLLNVCETVESSKLKNCAGASVCYQEGNTVYNYGLLSTQTFSYDGKRLRLTYFNGDDCPSGDEGKHMAEIFFTCNPNIGIGAPQIYKRYSCLVVFMWETSLVCRNPVHNCMFNLDGNQYDLHLLSSLSHNWNTTDDKGNTYWLNLCRGIQQNEETLGCPPSAAVCMKNIRSSHMPLGMLYTVQAKLANSSYLVLTYQSESSEPCTLIESTTEINATTRIFLRCSSSVGFPKLLSGPDNKCYYDFLWETSLACPETTQELFIEEGGILYDSRLKYGMDLRPILNRTFNVPGMSDKDQYIYIINLDKVHTNVPVDVNDACLNAAVCQTKPGTSFRRDVGSYGTRKFYLRGSELHLTVTSSSKPCGKNKERNVTTVIDMQCSTLAGIGHPEFLYESGGCDYVFYWETNAVCPTFKRPNHKEPDNNKVEPSEMNQSSSSHQTALALGLLTLIAVVCLTVFVLSKAERRAAVSSKFRSVFNRVRIPHFRYKRGDMLTELQSDF